MALLPFGQNGRREDLLKKARVLLDEFKRDNDALRRELVESRAQMSKHARLFWLLARANDGELTFTRDEIASIPEDAEVVIDGDQGSGVVYIRMVPPSPAVER